MVIPLLLLGGYPFIIGVSLAAMFSYKEIIELKKAHKPLPLLIVVLGLVGLLVLLLSNLRGFDITSKNNKDTKYTFFLEEKKQNLLLQFTK